MKSLLIALSMLSACCLVGCSGGDQDTEPVKPGNTAATTDSNPRPADPNPTASANATPPSQPTGETGSSTVRKF